MADVSELGELIHKLSFPPRSRPVWRNKNTGEEAAVLDLRVDDRGGFQGGCRRFVVVVNTRPPHVWALADFLKHWTPTGHVTAESLGL